MDILIPPALLAYLMLSPAPLTIEPLKPFEWPVVNQAAVCPSQDPAISEACRFHPAAEKTVRLPETAPIPSPRPCRFTDNCPVAATEGIQTR